MRRCGIALRCRTSDCCRSGFTHFWLISLFPNTKLQVSAARVRRFVSPPVAVQQLRFRFKATWRSFEMGNIAWSGLGRVMRCVFCLLMSLVFAAPLYAKSPWPASNGTPPANWAGAVFHPNFEFPTTPAAVQRLPWDGVDFRADPEVYLKAVLSYILEGMDTTTWDGRTNTVRQWYHAPWMHEGFNGREFIHGLTRERSSRKGELGAGQTRCYQNWSVAIANPAGGYAYGQVWGNGTALPDPRNSLFG